MDYKISDGIINILKPPGMTSSNAVSDVRRLFNIKRVGHTGTLDPGASGVLPICIGRATRLFDILVDKQKEYIAEISFGTRTDTQDSYGKVTEKTNGVITSEMLIEVLPSFIGVQKQTAPAYSALKVDGQALYTLARKGKEIPERVREIEITSLEYIAKTAHNRFLFKLNCSRGTYVRTLCEDIGRKLCECSHMSFLLRTRSGSFCVEESITIAELEALKEKGALADAIIPVEAALDFLPAINTDHEEMLLNGRADAVTGLKTGEYYRIYSSRFLGVGVALEEGIKLKLRF